MLEKWSSVNRFSSFVIASIEFKGLVLLLTVPTVQKKNIIPQNERTLKTNRVFLNDFNLEGRGSNEKNSAVC